MKAKICGVCRPEDARVAAAAGADFIGVILAARGPRQQSIEQARSIFAAAAGAARAGVFADQPVSEVASAARALQLDVVQLHGAESTQYINELEASTDCVIWKSVWLSTPADLAAAIEEYTDHVDGLHFDAQRGGSGKRFDWQFARDARELVPARVQLIVAGGLTPENVGDAIALLRPDVVDVSSGVEDKVGEKSMEKIHAFLKSVQR